ncbi:MAG: hypothetical protein OEY14_06175 [Myxococcales bacterium]|nr:hypothetical protein [Myxococcales bacterium]
MSNPPFRDSNEWIFLTGARRPRLRTRRAGETRCILEREARPRAASCRPRGDGSEARAGSSRLEAAPQPAFATSLALCAALALGCGSAAPERQQGITLGSSAGGSDAPGEAAQASSTPPGPPIQIANHGQEPRQLLRFDLDRFGEERGHLETRMQLETRVGGNLVPIGGGAIPTLRFPLQGRTMGISPEGYLRYELILGRVEVVPDPNTNPAVVAELSAGFADWPTVTSTGMMASNGFILGERTHIPPGTPANIRQALESSAKANQSVSVLFPNEPVGVGAVWSASQPIEGGGIHFEQEATYRLRSIEGDRVVLDLGLRQRASAQPMPAPDPSMTLQLDSLAGSGSGTLAIELHRMLCTSSATFTLEMQMTITTNGQRIPSTVHATTSIAMGHE